jgi:hypothetical protein
MNKIFSILILFFTSVSFAQENLMWLRSKLSKKINRNTQTQRESNEDLAKFTSLDFSYNPKAFVIARFVRTKGKTFRDENLYF